VYTKIPDTGGGTGVIGPVGEVLINHLFTVPEPLENQEVNVTVASLHTSVSSATKFATAGVRFTTIVAVSLHPLAVL
jgi:hypothetical protein